MKIKKIVAGILFLGNLSVVYFGNVKWNHDVDIQNAEARAYFAEYQANQKKKIEEEIVKWAPENGKPRSILDDIRYIKAKKQGRPIIITTLGSSVAHGDGSSDVSRKWDTQLVNYIIKLDKYTSVQLYNHGYGGYQTRGLLDEGKVDLMVKQKPDIVLFEACLINNHAKKPQLTLEDTFTDIKTTVGKIKTANPDALVILLTPNPKIDDTKNDFGLTLADYASATKKFSNENGLPFVDVHDGFMKRNADLKVLLKDTVHPNDDGYKIWFEIIREEFEKVN